MASFAAASSARRAQRLEAFSGNLASMTMPAGPPGRCIRQSGRLPFDSVAWKLKAPVRQAVLDDGLHAQLAEGAALLLVGEDVLQGDDARGQLGDVALGGVDHGEPLIAARADSPRSCALVSLRLVPR